ncbi:MAG: class I SAM-dependent methyltransferase [Myxococcota bacterium]
MGASPCPLCGAPAPPAFRLAHGDTLRCRRASCGLEFCAPQPDDAALDAHYRTLYYPESGTGLIEDSPDAVVRSLSRHLGRRPQRAGRTLLDFGCGTGRLLRAAREAGYEVLGVEADGVAREFAEHAAEAVVHETLDALRATEGSARFDVIVLWQVIEHLRMPWKTLASLSDLLTEGGELLIGTPNARGLKARLLKERWENRTNPTHLYYLDATSLRALLLSAGLDQIRRVSLPVDYPHHGPARRVVQRLLRFAGLDGDLIMTARRAAGPSA